MNRILLSLILILMPLVDLRPQGMPYLSNGMVHAAAGASGPTYVNSGGDFTGGGALTTGWSPTNGNTLIVWTVAADTTQTHTCSDGEGTGNTYTPDLATATSAAAGRMFHASNISGTGAYTITCTGATPLVAVVEISGNRTLDTASAGGTGGNAIIASHTDSSVTSCAPGAFTPTTAATALINGFGSPTGSTITAFTQTDASFTTRASALNGSTSFVGAIGSRIVAASASYTDGVSWTTAINDVMCMDAAYK